MSHECVTQRKQCAWDLACGQTTNVNPQRPIHVRSSRMPVLKASPWLRKKAFFVVETFSYFQRWRRRARICLLLQILIHHVLLFLSSSSTLVLILCHLLSNLHHHPSPGFCPHPIVSDFIFIFVQCPSFLSMSMSACLLPCSLKFTLDFFLILSNLIFV